MATAQSRFRPTRLIAWLTTLISLAVAVLWADSYRIRGADHLDPAVQKFREFLITGYLEWNHPSFKIGMDYKKFTQNRQIVTLQTFRGRMRLRFGAEPSVNDVVPSVSLVKFGFGYKQGIEHYSFLQNFDGNPNQFGRYRVREISAPFWALFLLCGAYPTNYFLRGPLRRRKRRRNGQCTECGYDLRGSTGQCPECGASSDSRIPQTTK